MPSQLVNLMRQLRWPDFGQPVQRQPPGPGQRGTAALTQTRYQFTAGAPERIQGSSPARFRLADSVTFTIQFQRPPSWVASWVFQRPTAEQDRLLKHEQGHYQLVALLVRDMFIDIMQLKQNVFNSSAEVNAAFEAVRRRYDPKIQPIQDRYDTDTEHALNQAQQARWDGFIRSAFTQARNPPMQAPDGAPYKTPILTVLQQAGISV